MDYPDIVTNASAAGKTIAAVARAVRATCGQAVAETETRDNAQISAVRPFLACPVDSSGRPLEIDDEIGPNT